MYLIYGHIVLAISSITLFDKLNIFLGCLLPPPVTQSSLGVNMASVRSSGVFFLACFTGIYSPKRP